MTQHSTNLSSSDQQVFTEFYDVYSPMLWGIILSVSLPTARSEKILINTFTKAWQQFDQQKPPAKRNLTWLLGLAYGEGLPMEHVRKVLLSKK